MMQRILGMMLVMGMAMGLRAGEVSLMDRFPAETVLFFEAPDIQAANAAMEKTAFGKILNEPELQEFLAPLALTGQDMIKKIEAFFQISIEPFIAAGSHRMGMGLLLKDMNTPPAVLFMAECPNADSADKLKVMLPKLINTLNEKFRMRMTPDESGMQWRVRGGPMLSCQFDGNMMLMALDMTNGATIPAVLSKDAPRLNTVAPMVAMRKTLGNNMVKYAMLNTAVLWPMVRELAAKAHDGKHAMAVLESLGLMGIEAVGMSLNTAGAGYTTRVALKVPQRTGMLAMLKDTPVSKELLGAIPANAHYVNTMGIDWNKLMPLIREVMVADGENPLKMEQGMQGIAMMAGFHPENDLLANMGDEFGLAFLPSDEIGGLPLFGLNSTVALVRVKNEAASKAVAKLFQLIGNISAGQRVGAALPPQEYKGTTITSFQVGWQAVAPAMAMRDNIMIIAATEDAVKYILDTMNGDRPNLLTSEAFVKGMEPVGGFAYGAISYAPKTSFLSVGGEFGGVFYTSVMAGMLMPALARAHDSAQNVHAMNDLKQVGMAFVLYETQKGKKADSLAELYDNGEGILGDPTIFVSDLHPAGFQYVSITPDQRKPNHILAFEAEGNQRDGKRVVLYRDGHVQIHADWEIEGLLGELQDYAKLHNATFTVQAPFVPEGMTLSRRGEKRNDGSGQAFLADLVGMQDINKNPEAFFRELLSRFPLSKLPPMGKLKRHLFGMCGKMQVDGDGVLFESYGPLPIGNIPETDLGLFSGLAGFQGNVAATSIIAAIAIPNLLQSRVQANQSNAVAALKAYASAQMMYKNANYAERSTHCVLSKGKKKWHADRFVALAKDQEADGTPIRLISAPFANADGTSDMPVSYQGYVFFDSTSKDMNWEYDFGLAAVPFVYGKSGVNSFLIGSDGIVYIKDLGGEKPTEEDFADPEGNGWVIA